jgi:hypothetical protein
MFGFWLAEKYTLIDFLAIVLLSRAPACGLVLCPAPFLRALPLPVVHYYYIIITQNYFQSR